MSCCWHKNGKHLCDDSSASKIFYYRSKFISKPKNLSLINKSYISSYQLKPDGSTNKFIYRFFCFSTHLKDLYMQFERKCTREVTLDGRSVRLLIEKIKKSDAFLMSLYTNPKLRFSIFSSQNLLNINSILKEYNLIVTKLLIINLNRLNKRVIQRNLSNELESFQCLLIESFSIVIYAINDIKIMYSKSSSGSISMGFRFKADFLKTIQKKRLIKTKYFFSTKSVKVKKNKPKIIKNNIFEDLQSAKQLSQEFNIKLQLELIKKVNLKHIHKNYKPINFTKK